MNWDFYLTDWITLLLWSSNVSPLQARNFGGFSWYPFCFFFSTTRTSATHFLIIDIVQECLNNIASGFEKSWFLQYNDAKMLKKETYDEKQIWFNIMSQHYTEAPLYQRYKNTPLSSKLVKSTPKWSGFSDFPLYNILSRFLFSSLCAHIFFSRNIDQIWLGS